ncbi:MAG: ROK family protein [Mobilicoccus sp.]|nr:ROK family protein [Mobilicoccus sp.]
MTTVGLDIGGTKTLGALVDEEGTILARARRDTPAALPEQIAVAAAEVIEELTAHTPVEAVGVACAGFLDRARERVLFAPNLAWRDEPLKERLEQSCGLPVVLENDANAAAWGEFVHGAAADVDHMVFITLGTGVGGGVVLERRLLRGAFGIGAELGHIRVVPDGELCGCGVRGCLEAYGSGSALLRAARAVVAADGPQAAALSARCGGDPDRLQGADVTAVALAGDPTAIELLADVGRWIGIGAASMAAVLDPEVIVLGGGVSHAGDLVLRPAEAAFAEHLTGGESRPRASFRLAGLLDDAGCIGAAALAREAGA